MGTYKFYKLDFAGWADRISGDSRLAEYWKGVLSEHPEFFRLDADREKASLVWRRQHQKRFHVDAEKTLSKDGFHELSDEEKARVSRIPLTSSEIGTLVQTAINLHARALEQKTDSRWWIVGFFGILGALVGALIHAWAALGMGVAVTLDAWGSDLAFCPYRATAAEGGHHLPFRLRRLP
ncbi:hypothetical protein [Thioalkalivibrio sp. ALJ1]|uniref:hypothetical protein n=1 Tax=Thioalkalivibrio sp. ALJ1 TaxID=1158144 RepID=UPI001AD819C8|nr:hypothetical protein [Thioalkalivibrio sp. ALJ1]